jgi:methylated-DNA-protein-cysteine methyltransferase related protein
MLHPDHCAYDGAVSGVHRRSPDEVLSRIRVVPAGFVTTYGDLSPSAPRFAGQVLSRCEDPGVPWQRVVRADGSLAKGRRQRRLLEAEGTPFRGQRVDLDVARIPAEALDDLTRRSDRS